MRFAALLVLFAACAGSTGSESDDLGAGQYQNPLLKNGDGSYAECPDPNVRQFGANYFMVCTSPNIGRTANAFPIHWSPDLVHWHFVGYVFGPNHHPSWAVAPGSGGTYWAPEIYRNNGKWLLVFAAKTADPSKGGSMAIGAASADALAGPWIPTKEPLVSQGDGSIAGPGDDNSGRIDPSVVRDPNTNDLYLYYVYQPQFVHVTRLAADGLSVIKGTDKELRLASNASFHATLPWEHDSGGHGVVEGVEANVRDGKFYLLYSGASTWDGTYAVGVARADSPWGPFEKHGAPILDSSTNGKLVGPGHSSQWVEGPNHKTYLLYHVQRRGHEGHAQPRLLALDEVTFDASGWPSVANGHPSESAKSIP